MLFKVNPNLAHCRLDKFLTEKLKSQSRSSVQKLIRQGLVLVNHKKTKSAHQFLKAGDQVLVKNFSRVNSKNKLLTRNQAAALKPKFSFKIIAGTADYLIINKPAGLVVHPNVQYKTNTLIQLIVAKYPEIGLIGENPERPGLVQRLDKDVSGLMVIARSKPMFEHLKQQFKQRAILKEYLAEVYGRIERSEGVIDFPLARSKKTGKMKALPKISVQNKKTAAMPSHPKAKSAYTYFEVVKRLPHSTLLKIQIKTGRTHQIRVHLNAYGHPIIGDQLYCSQRLKSSKKNDRLKLQAVKLGFKDLEEKMKIFTLNSE